MADEQRRTVGRRATDPDLAVVVERLDHQDELLKEIHSQTRETNGRVSELEVKDRIRNDREEQAAIRSAAAEATKYKIESAAEREQGRVEERQRHRVSWRVALIAVVVGVLGSFLVAVLLHALYPAAG